MRLLPQPADADDCFQHVWLRIHKGLEGYHEQGKIRQWIYSITYNCARDWLRAHKPQQALETLPGDLPARQQLVSAELEASDFHQMLNIAIEKLSPKLREIYSLRIEHELSYEEIGSMLDEPLQTLRARLHLAMRQLRTSLNKELL